MWIEIKAKSEIYLFNIETHARIRSVIETQTLKNSFLETESDNVFYFGISYDEIKQKIFEAQEPKDNVENFVRDEMAYADPKTHWPE